MYKFESKKEKENDEFFLYDKYFDQCDIEEDENLYKKQLYVLEDDKFTKTEQTNLTLKHKGLLNRLILEDFSVYPLKKDPLEVQESEKKEENNKKKLNNDEKDLKKVDELEKFAEDENEFIKDLHRINYLTFSPFSLSFFNKNTSSKNYYDSEKIIKERENENKLFKMINFDYDNYEFNEDLLFNICHGFVDPDKLKEENIIGGRGAKNYNMSDLNLNLIKKVDEKDETGENFSSKSNSKISLNKDEDKKDDKSIKEIKEEKSIDEKLLNEINLIIEEIDSFIKRKENIEFYKGEIKNYYEAKKKIEDLSDMTYEEKKKFYYNWLNKFHEIEVVYNNYRVQIQRTETIKKVREEKMKKKMEEERIRQTNEDNKFLEELNKIREKALQKKLNEEKGIISSNSSMYSDSSMTSNSKLGNSSYTSNIKESLTNKYTNTNKRKSQKKKTKKTERFDWMIKKNDNYFDQY